MTLEQLANIAEVFGMLVVAITLIYLTIQMRQNTKALRATAAQSVHEMAEAIFHPIMMDAALADVVIRGMRDPATLSEVETGRFTAQWMINFFVWQNWFYQWRHGALDEGIWLGYSKILTDVYQTPGIRRFWEQRGHYFSDEFRAYLEADLFTRQPTPDFTPLGTAPVSPATSTETGARPTDSES